MARRFNREVFFENIVGITAAGLVVGLIVFSAFWVTKPIKIQHGQTDNTQKTDKKLEQTLKANSVDAREIEKLYQQKRDEIAQKKAAEQQRLAEQQAKIDAEKKRLAEQQKQKRLAAEAEKKRLAEEKARLAKAQRQAKEREKKEQQRIAAERKRLAEEKEKADKVKKAAELARQKATEEKKQVEAERQKIAEEKQRQEQLAKEKAAADAKRRAAEKQRILDELAATQAAIEAEAKAKTMNRVGQAIEDKVKGRWTIPPKLPENLSAMLEIQTEITGEVKNVRITRSSGNTAFDRSAIQAVKEASPLPMPEKKTWAKEFATINMNFE